MLFVFLFFVFVKYEYTYTGIHYINYMLHVVGSIALLECNGHSLEKEREGRVLCVIAC